MVLLTFAPYGVIISIVNTERCYITKKGDIKMKFYVIDFECGTFATGYFISYGDALKYAEFLSHIEDDVNFTISVYDNEDDYFNSI